MGAWIVLLVLLIAGVGIYVYSGSYAIGADVPHTRFVLWLLAAVRDRALAAQANEIRPPPDLNDPRRIPEGAGQYAAMCSGCHLAPGYERQETWEGLYPQPPKLFHGTNLSPSEIFWVVKHGLKMTGMPAWGKSHSDEEMWSITAFVLRLPQLSPKQYKDMVSKAPMDPDMIMMPMPQAAPAEEIPPRH